MNKTNKLLALILAFQTSSALAQDDQSAGLFAEATQLPLIAQSVHVEIIDGVALVELVQSYKNTERI